MKCARLGLAAIAAVLAGLILLTTQPASGQSQANPTLQPSVSTAPNSYGGQWHYAPWIVGQASNPELHKLLGEEGNLEHETANLVNEYSRTEDESQRGKIRTKLAETLQKQFDLQQKRRDLEVAQIEAQLKKLREIMRKRSESRQTIIDKRLDQLLREAEGLGWTPPHGTPGGRNVLYPPITTAGQPKAP